MAGRSLIPPTAVTAAAGQRAQVYGFLAAALRAPLPAASLAAIAADPDAAGNPVAGAVRALQRDARVGAGDWTAAVADLAREHARLFCGLRQGHGPPPPYESLWREGQCLGDNNRRVAAAFAGAGFSAAGDGQICDHLVAELTFMASLCQAEGAAAQAGDDLRMALRRDQQRAFLDQHLLRWVPDYCAAVVAQTPVPLYQALLGELAAVMDREAALLDGADPPANEGPPDVSSNGANGGAPGGPAARTPTRMPGRTLVRTALALFVMLVPGLLPMPGLSHADEPIFGAPPKDPETLTMVHQWNGACIACHTEQALLFPPRAGMNLAALADALVDPFAFEKSQHTGMACKTCHGKGYIDYPHASDASASIMGCAECHAKEAFRVQAQFDQSVHARNLSDQFSCASCHDPHQDRVAADLDDARLVVAQDNGKCLSCHNSDERFAELGVNLAEARTRPDIDEIHKWLPNTQRHWQAVRCVECHTPPSSHSKLAVSHQILDADAAERNCAVCHSQDSALNLRLYRHLAQQETSELGFLNSAILGDNYVIGATRNVYLDRLAYWLVGLLIAALAIHGGLRILGSLLRRRTHS